MLKHIGQIFVFAALYIGGAFAQPNSQNSSDGATCATNVFADALSNAANEITPDASELDVRAWVAQTFKQPDVLKRVLACPGIRDKDEHETLSIGPIKYNFPGGRVITIDYEAQPKIFSDRIALDGKLSVDDLNPSPEISESGGNIWVNTDPAWYAIMVVQHGALDNFVGPTKNNTISLKYIKDNIDTLFPHGAQCTGKSALTRDNTMVNRAAHNMVDINDDTNDYYIAGDVNLQWISYLEIGFDVVLTVATMGGGAAALGATKSARAARVLKNLGSELRTLGKIDTVRDYIRASQRYARAADELKKIDRAADAAGYARKLDEIEDISKTMREMEQADKNVKRYREVSESFAEINKYRHALRGIRLAKRGNILARGFRAFKAANTGNKMINKGAKIARSSMKSGKVRDWLFHSTLRNAGKLAKLEETGAIFYGALRFIGGMWDWTDTSTDEYTSGLEFSPLLLLSADDLQGQENVINHGMWFLWMGNSTDAADDDAAYLAAMDTAAKFHQDLDELQTDENDFPCNVDIYVVRPIIRNPDSDNAALYYLIMNDEPWHAGPDE